MASQRSSGDVEILIHVTAPSRVADDVTYRALAQAYLDFRPGSRADVTIPSSPEPQQPPPSRQNNEQEDDEDVDAVVLQSFCSDSQDISFRGVLDNLASPRLRSKASRIDTPEPSVDEEDGTTSRTVRHLPSQIADSYPMPDVGMFNVTPTRVLQKYMGTRAQAPRLVVASSPPSCPVCDEQITPKTEAQDQAIDISSSLPTSEAPESGISQTRRDGRQSTIPVTPLISEANRKRKAEIDLEDTSAMDVTHISSSIPSSDSSTNPLQRSESDPLPSKRLCQIAQDSGVVTLIRSTSDTTKPTAQPTPQPTPQPSSSPLSYAVLSQVPSTYPRSTALSVRPPSPPVGVGDLSLPGLVSAKLAKLARDLSSRYRPTTPPPRDRPLDPLERGYWLVDCSGWPDDVRADAWAFLTSYVRSGLAGWGVWCRRAEDHASIRLYCWAHVVKHTYLLLYLASARQIKTTGAKWFDAEGVVAVEVLP